MYGMVIKTYKLEMLIVINVLNLLNLRVSFIYIIKKN